MIYKAIATFFMHLESQNYRNKFDISNIDSLKNSKWHRHIRNNILLAAAILMAFYAFIHFTYKDVFLIRTALVGFAICLTIYFIDKFFVLPQILIKNTLIFVVYFVLVVTVLYSTIYNEISYIVPTTYWFSMCPILAFAINDRRNATIWGIIVFITTSAITCFLLNYPHQLLLKGNDFFYLDQYALNIVILISLFFLNKIYGNIFNQYNEINQKLILANQEILQLQKSKDLFFANISHEIRTPLNAIIGISSILKRENNNSNEAINILSSSSHILLNIINDILDLSKLNENKLLLSIRHENLKNTIQNTFTISKFEAEKKGIEFKLFFSENFPDESFFDEYRVSQIILNLISNAIKFTEKGSVIVTCNLNADNCLEIAVEDTGIGISKEMMQRLYTNYSQENEMISRKYKGTGLGLSLAFKLAKLMKGNIHCESAKGKGSIFTFTFPYCPELAQVNSSSKFSLLQN